MKFVKFDAKSGEIYVVGAIEWNLFEDPTYLDAVDSGDVHTAVARICWPELGGQVISSAIKRLLNSILSTLHLPFHV